MSSFPTYILSVIDFQCFWTVPHPLSETKILKQFCPPQKKKQPIIMKTPEEVNTKNCSILMQIKPTYVLLCVIFILELGWLFHLLSVLLTLKHHYCNLLKCCKSQSACKLILQHIYIRLRRTECIWSFISMFCLTPRGERAKLAPFHSENDYWSETLAYIFKNFLTFPKCQIFIY